MRIEDAPSVAALVRDSFESRYRSYIPYCQPRADRFLVGQIDGTRRDDSRAAALEQVAVGEAGEIIGYAEMRLNDADNATLTYLATHPAWRGQGVARRLIASLQRRCPSRSDVGVDVFEANEPALALYKRLGASIERTSTWWVRKADITPDGDRAAILDLERAVSALEQHGFSQVTFESYEGQWSVDMPSSSVVRIRGPLTSTKLNAVPHIQEFAPVSEVLYISDSPPPVLDGWWPLLRAHRLALPWTATVRQESL